ncbi:MAG: sigma-54-dependent Fis family transcriptional regulator [Polyangiaceae bacterium]|nr:sigma-54-dependent Fis family transcriptional regulator [Polyangiaceae bacterium]
MSERTDTHTALDLPELSEARPVIGVVVAFSEGLPERRAIAVEGRVRVGRDPELELSVDDGKASRCHAELSAGSGGVVVTDLESRNGTFVDEAPLEAPGQLAKVGSTIRIGRTVLLVVANVRPYLREPLSDPLLLGGPALDETRQVIAVVGPSRVPVLIEGETGTGKELVAQAIHRASGRKGELCAVNCAALPAELVESELFGHARGAFSSSAGARKGLFRAADGGSLFLDEIGDLPLASQAKLLRVLETGEVRAVGEDQPIRVDVRVIAATNRDLERMITEGQFRADLFHRIATGRVVLPPLRARREDVPLLAQTFVRGDLTFTARAMDRLMAHGWPGNVRELKNVIAAGVARVDARGSARIDAEDLHLDARAPSESAGADERRVRDALAEHAGNVTHVARALGVRRAALYELFKRLAIDPAAYRR